MSLTHSGQSLISGSSGTDSSPNRSKRGVRMKEYCHMNYFSRNILKEFSYHICFSKHSPDLFGLESMQPTILDEEEKLTLDSEADSSTSV